MRKNRCFVGLEAEGSLQDVSTLFVGDDFVLGDSIVDYCKDNPDIKHVYFGADKLRRISMSQILILETILKMGLLITIEVEEPFRLYDIPEDDRIRIVIAYKTRHVPQLLNRNIIVKLEDEQQLIVLEPMVVYKTDLKDERYSKDKTINL